jgi:hypothetical protein
MSRPLAGSANAVFADLAARATFCNNFVQQNPWGSLLQLRADIPFNFFALLACPIDRKISQNVPNKYLRREIFQSSRRKVPTREDVPFLLILLNRRDIFGARSELFRAVIGGVQRMNV